MHSSPQYIVSIHLGASALSLLVTQVIDDEEEILEFLEQPVPFARDIFGSGRVRRETIERCVDILQNYLKVLSEFGITIEGITIAAITNILREAKNRHVVLNRLEVALGMKFAEISNGSMTRLIFNKAKRHLIASEFDTSGKVLLIHVGPGNTRLLLLHNGKVERFSTYRLGSHRTAEALYQDYMNGKDYLTIINGHCAPFIDSIQYDFRNEDLSALILIGNEIQKVERVQGKHKISKSLEKYQKTLQSCAEMSEEERIKVFQLDYHSEDAFLPSLQINYSLVNGLGVDKYWIPASDYEQGLLIDLPITRTRNYHFSEESLHAARLLAKKYGADPRHYEHVLTLCEDLFNQTKDIHRMGEWELFLLQITAIVHEVGGYIAPQMHHKHSYYLITHSEIFGIDQQSNEIIALVSRYHRQSPPKLSHEEYRRLSREDQVLVSKLSALLRVADALDAALKQRISNLAVSQEKKNLILTVDGPRRMELEKIAIRQKGNLFEEIFGLKLKLRTSSQI